MSSALNNQAPNLEGFEGDPDKLSTDSNDALNVIEELVLYIYSHLNKD